MADGNDRFDQVPLRDADLGKLPAHVLVPEYDRKALRPGIVHIGVGNFHRAHQSWYLHRLMQAGLTRDWAIIGAGVRAGDARMRDLLAAQDYLTTLVELDPAQSRVEIVGSMIGFLPVQDDNAALIAQMSDPAIRIVSLTVTEGGYYLDPASAGFDAAHPDMVFDAANPATPRTAFGAMIAALRARRDAGQGAFTAQSCDNLQGNGDILRQTVLGLAGLSDPDLAAWIAANATFPNSMVDCIVPATGPAELDLVREHGINDAAPVTHESFRQWVIEDNFCAGRPEWDAVGATFTDDVHAFETMKIRLLNAGHQVLANAGEILSVDTIAGCMEHPEINALFRKVLGSEAAPHVLSVPGMAPADYVDLIAGRFTNPLIHDTTRRVAFDGSSRHTGFLIPTIRDALAAGTPTSGLALVEALWARMCAGTREDGSAIEANDPQWDTLVAAAQEARNRPLAWLEQSQLYGALGKETVFAEAFEGWLTRIWRDGTKAAIRHYVAGNAA